ncbi:unnamed protein product [Meloidogyne enterolobii]|uniref:Uncharacterized protein n=1 Tax=Meloidogyne enterolobii TaxID=390850 RepID=A0ACB0YZB8_MELEN
MLILSYEPILIVWRVICFAHGDGVVTHSESTDADAPRVEFEYETRTLFFKSLNSAIERRLLSEGFVRFGRWLCRPLELSSLYAEDKHTIPK